MTLGCCYLYFVPFRLKTLQALQSHSKSNQYYIYTLTNIFLQKLLTKKKCSYIIQTHRTNIQKREWFIMRKIKIVNKNKFVKSMVNLEIACKKPSIVGNSSPN